MIRDDIKAALIGAMKGGDKAATGTIRLIQSAIQNRDIELRTGTPPADDDALVTEVLQKMIKQRRESVELYRKGEREELAAIEEAEIVVIERFASSDLTAADTAWATAIHDEFDAQGVPVRGILLSHRRGIRWIAQDDYRY